MSQEYLILCRSSIVLKRDTQGYELNRDNQSKFTRIYKGFNILFIAIYPITAGVCGTCIMQILYLRAILESFFLKKLCKYNGHILIVFVKY